jgi:Tfp pilus assembly protein PilF
MAKDITVKGFVKAFLDRHRRRPEKPFCFVLGSGASRPSGITTGDELVREWLKDLHERYDCAGRPLEDWATPDNMGIPGFEVARAADFYADVYARQFPVPEDGFAFLEGLMAGKTPSFGYSVLAYLLSNTQHQVVITTNFDNLVASALSIHSETFPRVVGHDELVRFVGADMRRPLVAKIHGDLGFALKNRPDEVAALSDGWTSALKRILTRFTPIFIGYSGNDGSLMDFLLRLDPGTPDTLFWCWRTGSRPSDRIREVVDRHSGSFVEIEGFDEIMMRLLDGLGDKRPDLVSQLEQRFQQQLDAYKQQRATLGEKLAQESSRKVLDSAGTPPAKAGPGVAEQRSLLDVAGRVLTDPSQAKTWWQWQAEVDQQTSPDETDARYKEALVALPNEAGLLGNYAIFLDDVKKDPERADEFYRRAIDASPKNANTLGNYAVFLKNVRKDSERADVFYRRAIDASPKNADILGSYALFLDDVKKDPEKADEFYRRAIDADPNNAKCLSNYAVFLDDIKKDSQKADEFYRRAIDVDPSNANTLGNAARHYFCVGRSTDGRAALERAEAANTPNEGTAVEIAFYRVAHIKESWPAALGPLKRLILQGARSPGWALGPNVDRAEAEGHPEPALLRAIASVISDGASAGSLENFATWRAAD